MRDPASARPCDAANFVESKAAKVLPTGGKGDDGFCFHDKVKLAGAAIGHQFGIFGGFLPGLEGCIDKLEAPEPFHAHITLESRQEQTQWIALLGPQPFAVLCVSQEYV